MKLQELRIGNIVKGISTEYCYIEQIGFDKVMGSTIRAGKGISSTWRSTETVSDMISPIPLDEAWMVKLGFELDHTKQTFQTETYALKDFEIEYDAMLRELKYNRILLKSVHQLQNLYFALTGEELTIKETANGTI